MWLLTRTANVCSWLILLQNSLLRCQYAIIESKKPASRIGYCALWLISESILRVGASKMVLQQYRAEAAQIHGRSHGGFRGQTGLVVLTPSFVESDRSRTS